MFMRERPKHLEKAVADPRNEEPASPLRWETALKDQAERVAALRRALPAPWHACPGLPLPRGVHGPYQKQPCRKKWSGKALPSLILATLLFGINALLKPSRAGSATALQLHLFGKRRRDPRSTAQVIRAKRREIEVLQQPAPDEQGSDAQLSPVGVCS